MNKNKIVRNEQFKRNWPKSIWDNWFTPFNSWDEENWETKPFRSELQEDQDNYYVKAELAGVPKENIDIELVNNQLRICAEKEEKREDANKKYHFSELSYGSFIRTYNFPSTVSSQDIKADYKEGLLTITIPKSAENKGKKVRIS